MAYRVTEKVQASMDARRASFIAAAIDIITKSGIDSLNSTSVVLRAKVSTGLLYNYFPDMSELRAAVTAQLLSRDLKAMRHAAEAEKNPLHALAAALAVFFARLDQPHIARAMAEQAAYRAGIRAELERLIAAAGLGLSPRDRVLAAASLTGALHGLADVSDGAKNRASAATLFALRALGVSSSTASKLADRRYSKEVA